MVYVIQVCWQLASRIRTEPQFHPDPVWHIPLLCTAFHPVTGSSKLYLLLLLLLLWPDSPNSGVSALHYFTPIFQCMFKIISKISCLLLQIIFLCFFFRLNIISWIIIITSIYQPTNAHIISHKTILKHFKTLRHVSILSDHHQGALFLAKVILQYSQFNSYLQTRCCGSISCCVVEQ